MYLVKNIDKSNEKRICLININFFVADTPSPDAIIIEVLDEKKLLESMKRNDVSIEINNIYFRKRYKGALFIYTQDMNDSANITIPTFNFMKYDSESINAILKIYEVKLLLKTDTFKIKSCYQKMSF